ncbi:MAG: hypothetical protein V7638_3407 [Acidobacteriota bacterium]|jgi:hypothetical protein
MSQIKSRRIFAKSFAAFVFLCATCTLVFMFALQPSTAGQIRNLSNAPESRDLLTTTVAALGGAERLRGVRSLSMTGTFRRAFPDQDRSGAYEFYFMAPDKLKLIETGQATDEVQFILTHTLSRTDTWSRTDVVTSELKLNVGSPQSQSNSPNTRKQFRAYFTPHLLPFLLAAPELELQPDEPASVFHFRGPDDLAARVVVDPRTHLPASMSYRGRPPVVVIDASNPREEEGAPGSETEIQVQFSDYRAEDGILLPHRIRVESRGKLLQEFVLKTCRINPEDVTAKAFVRN